MPLRQTEEDLYDPNSKIEERKYEKGSFDIDKTVDSGDGKSQFGEEKPGWGKRKTSIMDEGMKKIITIGAIAIGVLLVLTAITVGIIKYKQGSFAQGRVAVFVEGPSSSESAKIVKYLVKYKNDNRISLKNVEITLNHSENFYPERSDYLVKNSDRSSRISIGEIEPRSEGEIEVIGKFYAAEDYTVYLQPVMAYNPGNSSSRFQTDSQLGVKITTSPVSLEIISPKEALDESTAEYEIKYKNMGTVSFNSLNLRMDYSDGFIFQGADPEPVEGNNIWHIGNLSPGSEGSIKLRGKIDGNQFDVKSIKGTIFKNESGQKEIIFGRAEEVTRVVVPPLVISHKINGQSFLNFNAGEVLRYRIDYANRGETGLRDVILKLTVDSPVIDYAKLQLKSGAYESKTKTITWKASDIRALENLEPGESGYIDMELPIKEKIEIVNEADRNFIVESVVTIDSSDVAFHSLGSARNISNKVIAKLNSKVILEQSAFYKDLNIENFGPIPPKLGEETSYVIHWKVSNVSNDISSAEARTFLPTGVNWKGKIFPDNESVSFNERTHEIVWSIGRIKSATGILTDPREVSFQVSVVPEINQLKKDVVLITKTTFTAKDDFTDNDIKAEVGEKTTRIIEDKTVDENGYMVVE